MRTAEVAEYYRARILEHGPEAAGVDWNSEESQLLRFEQLVRLFVAPDTGCSVLDYGCGYGAMYPFLRKRLSCAEYCGFDIVPEMLAAARKKYPEHEASWCPELPEGRQFDFAFASGVFNVRLSASEDEWKAGIRTTILELARCAKRGFAFNALSIYSDPPKRKEYLHYADPRELFDFCKREISREVSLLHDYPLYEFTIVVANTRSTSPSFTLPP